MTDGDQIEHEQIAMAKSAMKCPIALKFCTIVHYGSAISRPRN